MTTELQRVNATLDRVRERAREWSVATLTGNAAMVLDHIFAALNNDSIEGYDPARPYSGAGCMKPPLPVVDADFNDIYSERFGGRVISDDDTPLVGDVVIAVELDNDDDPFYSIRRVTTVLETGYVRVEPTRYGHRPHINDWPRDWRLPER